MRYRLAIIGISVTALSLAIPVCAQNEPQQDQSESSARASEMSSSKDTRIDLSPPANDQKNHPMSGAAVSDAEDAASDDADSHARASLSCQPHGHLQPARTADGPPAFHYVPLTSEVI